MKAINVRRQSWKNILRAHAPLVLPSAHDALTARIIERAGFKAYQTGGFSLAAAEVSIGLGIIVAIFRTKATINIDDVNVMKF